MDHDIMPNLGFDTRPQLGVSRPPPCPLTPEQQEFARVLGRLLAELWDRRRADPAQPAGPSGTADGPDLGTP